MSIGSEFTASLQRVTHHLCVGASVKGLSKDRHHKHVDQEGDEQRHGRLDEEVLVGLFNVLLAGPIHLPGLGSFYLVIFIQVLNTNCFYSKR